MAPAKKTTTQGAASKSKTATPKAASAKSKASAAKPKVGSAKPETTSRKPGGAAAAKALAATEERRRLIEARAYLKAEADGFSGDPVQYWLAAEAEVATKPAGRK